MAPNRREVLVSGLVKGVVVLGIGSAVVGLASILGPKLGNDTEWEEKIAKLQKNAGPAGDGVEYKHLEGRVYDIEVDGKPVHVNLSDLYWTRRGHSLKYTVDEYSVCVSVRGPDCIIVETSPADIVINSGIVATYLNFTDKVLDALVLEQERLIKERREDLLERPKQSPVY